MKSILLIFSLLSISLILSCSDDGSEGDINAAPEVANPVADVSLEEGFQSSTVDLSNVFSDEDGDNLSLSASSSASGVVTVSVSGTTLTITEAGTGTATITVTASDGNGGSANDQFAVAVSESNNTAPTVANEIADVEVNEGFESTTVDLSNVFSDTDGDNLTYSASSSSESVVTVSVSGTTLTITEVTFGESTVTVSANDDRGGMVSDEFLVTVIDIDQTPEVVAPIGDQDLTEGFTSAMINLTEVFADGDVEDNLAFGANSSNTDVVTATVIEGSILSLEEVGVGEATITVSAYDDAQNSVSDEFLVIVSTCDNDNSLNTTNTVCDKSPSTSNSYSESVSAGMRTITTNRVPEHDYGNQLSAMGVTGLISTTESFSFTASPSLAASTTDILDANNRPAYDYGIALNGVPIDPAPAEPFIFENPNTGEYNWDWVFEPNNNRTAVGLDCNTAHLQPTDNNTKGLIHYHGDMVVYANSLLAGLGDGTTTPTSSVQIGWASDGFPIVYKYGPNAAGTGVEKLTSSYQLKSGGRPGDGVTEPCGVYNGKYTNDYEYVASSGDLDECNGISRSITLTTTEGSETFSYFYVITDEFPIIGRCLSGTPASDFSKAP